MAQQVVQFARGPKAAYGLYSDAEKARKIYFALDTNEIIVNSTIYGVNLKALDLDILATVEMTAPGVFIFTKTNGKTTTLNIPVATQASDGLLSKEDKKFIDSIPSTYATKEELNQQTTRVYRFKGTVQFFTNLPTEGMEIGDVYNILNPFEINSNTFSGGTNVAWDGSEWDPLGGESGYSKEESDNKFVSWTEDTNGKKLIILPQGGKIIGTLADNDGTNLILLGIYLNGTYQLVEVGSVKHHLCVNSLDRPHLDLPNGIQEKLAYLSDIGHLDLSGYSSGAIVSYVSELKQELIDTNGNPVNVNGSPYHATQNPYVLGKDYIVVEWVDNSTTYYDLYTADSVIPNATLAAINGVRMEYIEILTWEETN